MEGYLRILEMNTALGNSGMMVKGPTMWNSMPREFRLFSGSIASFKKDLKIWIRTRSNAEL